MSSRLSARFAPLMAAGLLSLIGLCARAADVPATLDLTLIGDELKGQYTVNFSSEVDQTGFKFMLTQGFAYVLTLEVDSTFAQQSGLTGYAIKVGFDSNANWGELSANAPPESYRLPLPNASAGEHFITLSPLNYGAAGSTALNLTALRQPVVSAPIAPSAPIPEPHTYALMLAGLSAVAWAARRRSTVG